MRWYARRAARTAPAFEPFISSHHRLHMHGDRPTEFRLDITGDWNRWGVFGAIAELGSFTRTGRGVGLSKIGQRLSPQVRALLCSALFLEADIRSNVLEPLGRVTLGVLPSSGFMLVSRLFP